MSISVPASIFTIFFSVFLHLKIRRRRKKASSSDMSLVRCGVCRGALPGLNPAHLGNDNSGGGDLIPVVDEEEPLPEWVTEKVEEVRTEMTAGID